MIHENELRRRENGFERNNSWAMMETDRCPQSMDSRQFDALERGPRSTRFFELWTRFKLFSFRKPPLGGA